MYKLITKCRICSGTQLEPVIDLGIQALTGVFPRSRTEKVTAGPLRLVRCSGGKEACGLLQLEHSYDLAELYGDNYGYRSGLNPSMVAHLHERIASARKLVKLSSGDLILDIGSNDSTSLQAYPTDGLTLVGIDPTGVKFGSFYPAWIKLIPDFFSARLIQGHFPGRKAKIITSFSMFYDLEDPVAFMREIHQVLAEDGVWMFEQSYMPAMLRTNSYDTICHEHLEFYALKQIKWMTDRVGFRIINVELNDTNGGSFCVTVRKGRGSPAEEPVVQKILDAERAAGLGTSAPYDAFVARVEQSRRDFLGFLAKARSENKWVAAFGASTKGNVLLQYCGLTANELRCVGEVNPDKVGCFTPGTGIPIVSEDELLAMKPDYVVILPWHFREFFRQNPKFAGCRMIAPLPEVAAISSGK